MRLALESCVARSILPYEIIGDDSSDVAMERTIRCLETSFPFPVVHRRHEPPLGQNANVDDTFFRSQLVLLHDDDLLAPTAFETLSGCWDREPSTAGAFGRRIVIK